MYDPHPRSVQALTRVEKYSSDTCVCVCVCLCGWGRGVGVVVG